MSDSSRISHSRCPENATWIGGSESPISNFSDKTYPEEVARLPEEEDQLIVDACWSNNSLAAVVGLLARCLRGRIFDIEDAGRHREEKQRSVYDFNNALAERVSSLATTNCTMWVDLAESRKLAKMYRTVIIIGVVVIAMIGIVLASYKPYVYGCVVGLCGDDRV